LVKRKLKIKKDRLYRAMAKSLSQRQKPLSRFKVGENSKKKNKKNYQTIIIGAGPAGLIASHYLKDALIFR